MARPRAPGGRALRLAGPRERVGDAPVDPSAPICHVAHGKNLSPATAPSRRLRAVRPGAGRCPKGVFPLMPVPATGAARRGWPVFSVFALGLALLALTAGAPAASAASLTVTITGTHSARGDVYVALFATPDHFPDGDYSLRHLKVKASTAPIVIRFDDLKPGTYAVGCYHDEDKLGYFKTNWIGYPLDGYALSNGIRAVVSRPTFSEAAFKVDGDHTAVTLNIRY